eukprot:38385-Prymnesium_polylepis.1
MRRPHHQPPRRARRSEWFMTQFLDAPASLEGGGSGELFGYEAEPESAPAAALRSVGDRLGVPIQAKTVLRRLRRSRVWHCYCAGEPAVPRAGSRRAAHSAGE